MTSKDKQTTEFFHALADAMVANYKPSPAPARKRVTLSVRSWRKALELLAAKSYETLVLMPNGSGAILYAEPDDVRCSKALAKHLVKQGWIVAGKVDWLHYKITDAGRKAVQS